jgi:hypothetical protein
MNGDADIGSSLPDDVDEISGYYNDDGSKINPELVVKPALCLSCRHDDELSQEILCNLTRMDRQDATDFICGAYERKTIS